MEGLDPFNNASLILYSPSLEKPQETYVVVQNTEETVHIIN